MEPVEASEYAKTDPELGAEEKEFTIGCTKKDNKARFQTNIASQVKRALRHSDIEADEISVYNEDDGISRMSVEDFDGNGKIVGFRGTLPLGLIKLNSNPRTSRSFAAVISPQNEVNID